MLKLFNIDHLKELRMFRALRPLHQIQKIKSVRVMIEVEKLYGVDREILIGVILVWNFSFLSEVMFIIGYFKLVFHD
jgi:hypothetical protein